MIRLIKLRKQYKQYNTCNDKFIKVINRALIIEALSFAVVLFITFLVVTIIEIGL